MSARRTTRFASSLAPLAALTCTIAAGGATAARELPTPTIVGPRSSPHLALTFRFASRGAAHFRCAFDTPALHVCRTPYTQRLTVGRHLLRVQAVAGDGHTSTVAQLNIVAGAGLTELPIGVTIPVGREPGLPVFADDALWVPSTLDGTVERIDPDTNRVAATIAVASYAHPLTRGTWTNALAAGAGSIWDVVDSADTLVRIDPATNAVSARILVPGASQAVVGAGAVWVTDFDQPRVYRIDPATNTVAATILLPIRRDQTGGCTGVAAAAGRVWVGCWYDGSVYAIDPAANTVDRRLRFAPPGWNLAGPAIWQLAPAATTLWASLPLTGSLGHLDLTRVTTAGRVLPSRGDFGTPALGLTGGGGWVWSAQAAAVTRLEPASGRVTAVTPLPSSPLRGAARLVGLAYGGGALWAASAARDAVYRIPAPARTSR